MADTQADAPEHRERPAFVDRGYLIFLLRPTLYGLPDDLLPPWVDYLEARGVVVRNGDAYELPDDAGGLLAIPRDAQRTLNSVIIGHARSQDFPPFLKHVLHALPAGGSGAPSSSGAGWTYAVAPARPSVSGTIEALKWNREDHIRTLAPFGGAAERLYEHVLASLERQEAARTASISSQRSEDAAQPSPADRRPMFANTDVLVQHLGIIVRHRLKDDLVPTLANYLLRLGLVRVTAPDGSVVASATRDDLHRALAEFANTRRCPPILRYVIPGLQGELFAVAPHYLRPERTEIVARLESEHSQHVASLADFGEQAQAVCRSIELGVLCLMPDPADYPSPSPMAAALRLGAALEEDLRDLAEQSSKMTDVEKLTAFRERLGKLRWKLAFCKDGWRPPSAPLTPHRGIRIGGASREDDEPPPPPSPAELERCAAEREVSRNWFEAMAIPWLALVLPVVQSCRDVGQLAQKYEAEEALAALALTASRELWKHAITQPREAALTALDGIEARMDLLSVRVTRAAQPKAEAADPGEAEARRDTTANALSAPLVYPRPLDAKQACLDALERAPRGIPSYAEISKATGYAETTLKETMPALRKARFVEKRDGMWQITEKGRIHLRSLREAG